MSLRGQNFNYLVLRPITLDTKIEEKKNFVDKCYLLNDAITHIGGVITLTFCDL